MTPDNELIEQAARVLAKSEHGDEGEWPLYVLDAQALLPLFHRVREEGIEEAAGVAQEAMILLSLGTPGEGPFTRQDRTVDEARAQIVAAILALKEQSSGEG